MRSNHLKERLRAGQPVYGAWLNLPTPATCRIMARQGYDWITVDMEHAHQDLANLAGAIAAIADAGTACAPLVRIPNNSVEWFKWALDAGAWGVIVPMVNNREEAARAVAWAKYPPEGIRSMGGPFAPYGFGAAGWDEYFARANAEILVAVQIESAPALVDLDGIIGTPGVDVAFVGPNDLHAQIGLPPSSEGAEPEFVAALGAIIAAGQRHGRGLGIFCSDGAAARMRVAQGFQMVSVTTDVSCLSRHSQAQLEAARGAR